MNERPSQRRDANRRNHARRPGIDWFRVFTYLVGGLALAFFWWCAIVGTIAIFG